METMKLLAPIAYHRNGVSGLGFYVAIIESEGQRMVVTRFPKEADKQTGGVVCSAFNIDRLNENDCQFFSNSYRGDYFSDFMDKEIEKKERKDRAETRRANREYDEKQKELQAKAKALLEPYDNV